MLRFAALVLCVVCPLAQSQQLVADCGKPASQLTDIYTPGSRIVNGKIIKDNSWPWLAAMVKYDPNDNTLYQFCGSTVINKDWIVTASHCVADDSQSVMVRTIRIVPGSEDLLAAVKSKGIAALLKITKVIVHPQYDQPAGSTNNDIALIKLASPLTFTSEIKPACLPNEPLNATVNRAGILKNKYNNRPVAFVAGWGHQQEGGAPQSSSGPVIGAGSDVAKQVDIEMYTNADCKSRLRGYTFTDQMICGGFEQGGKDSCQGDSGGPLVQKGANGAYELSGVVSWGAGCARAGMPGIYANVHALKTWVLNTIKNN